MYVVVTPHYRKNIEPMYKCKDIYYIASYKAWVGVYSAIQVAAAVNNTFEHVTNFGSGIFDTVKTEYWTENGNKAF